MIVPSSGVKVLIALKPVDFRNYAEHRIMRSPDGLTVTWAGFGGRRSPHNFGRSPAAEHGQELVRRSEPTGPEVWR